MFTRQQHEIQKELTRERKRKQLMTSEGRQKQNESNKRSRQKNKMEWNYFQERIATLEKKTISLKQKIQNMKEIIKEKEEHIEFLEECLEKQRKTDLELPMQTQEEEIMESEKTIVENEQLVQRMIQNEKNCNKMTRFTTKEFEDLVNEMKNDIEHTTYQGTERKQTVIAHTKYSIPLMIFITLFWLAHYPTLSLISCIFNIHERTITQLLKKTLVGMSKKLKNEIKWPLDEEFEKKLQDFTFFQNSDFVNMVCVVDGTEIKISRPSKEPYQHQVYSGKKKQHSLNVLFITWLSGEIIFFSPARIGAHDQSHWNELNLREKFIAKNFGIGGDGGFTFNRKKDEVRIHGYKPYTAFAGGTLSEEQKKYNKHLSQMRVVVENSLARVKQWKILKGVFRHWRNGQGQINIDDVLIVTITLANRKIKQSPP